MNMREAIEERLGRAFEPLHLELLDETGMHNVPPDSASHWKVLLVSENFEGMRSLARHRSVYKALSKEMSGGIHALSIVALAPSEWEGSEQDLPPSPPCAGGSRNDV